jgi:hypothetical protein
MQPYFFPYLGYLQLISAVDKFVIYDDVSFMKQSWVNRNRVLLQGRPHVFSVPLEGASSNRTIRDTTVSLREYPRWRDKFLKTIALAYSKAPLYQSTRALLLGVLDAAPGGIGELASRSILAVCQTLALPARIVPSSTIYENGSLRGQDRILDICAREGATTYINAWGGRELYNHGAFAARGMHLRFLRSRLPAYPQFDQQFVPALSILDMLMFNPPESVRDMLAEYDLEE